MIRPGDILLVLVAFAGMAAGVLLPRQMALLTPWVMYFMMTILFLSFINIEFKSLVRLRGNDLLEVIVWMTAKLILMPLAFWALAYWLAPEWALAVLLLAGTSSGVMAPFFANLLDSDVNRPLQVVVVTSLLLPVTLPLLVKFLFGHELHIPFMHMFRLLGLIVFLPLTVTLLGRRFAPGLIDNVRRHQFPVLLVCVFLCNAGVFAPQADFLSSQIGQALAAVLLAGLVALASAALGLGMGGLGGRVLDGMTGAITFTYSNSILIIVFAAQFFGPRAPLLAATYILPFFLMIVPLRWVAQRYRIG